MARIEQRVGSGYNGAEKWLKQSSEIGVARMEPRAGSG